MHQLNMQLRLCRSLNISNSFILYLASLHTEQHGKHAIVPELDILSEISKVVIDLRDEPGLHPPQQVVHAHIWQSPKAGWTVLAKPLLLLPHGFRQGLGLQTHTHICMSATLPDGLRMQHRCSLCHMATGTILGCRDTHACFQHCLMDCSCNTTAAHVIWLQPDTNVCGSPAASGGPLLATMCSTPEPLMSINNLVNRTAQEDKSTTR